MAIHEGDAGSDENREALEDLNRTVNSSPVNPFVYIQFQGEDNGGYTRVSWNLSPTQMFVLGEILLLEARMKMAKVVEMQGYAGQFEYADGGDSNILTPK